MSWSYSGDPSSSAKDAVRFLIGDTDTCDQLLQDAEIQYLLNFYQQAPMNTAIRACEAIMTKFSRQANESVGQVKIDFNQKYKAYRDMQRELQRRLATEDMVPYAGGISVSDIKTKEADSDVPKPDFRKHMMENEQISPWVTQSMDEFLGGGQ